MSEKPIKVGLVNLGCPKNQVDAEIMLDKLAAIFEERFNEAYFEDGE